MSQTARPSEAHYSLHETYKDRIEEEAEKLGLDASHLLDVVIEEGLHSIKQSKENR